MMTEQNSEEKYPTRNGTGFFDGYWVFDCDCGNTLAAERTECKNCGAHYDFKNGEVVQLAPPIGEVDND